MIKEQGQLNQLRSDLGLLVLDCSICHKQKTQFCLQKVCRDEPLFCESCQPHLTHSTSCIEILFAQNQKNLRNTYFHIRKVLENQIQKLEDLIKLYSQLLWQAISELDCLMQDQSKWERQLLSLLKTVKNHKQKGSTNQNQLNSIIKKVLKEPENIFQNFMQEIQTSKYNYNNKFSPFCYFEEDQNILNLKDKVQMLLSQFKESTMFSTARKFSNQSFIKLKKYPIIEKILKESNRARMIGFDEVKAYKCSKRIAIYRQSQYGSYTLPKRWHQSNPVQQLYLLAVDVNFFPRNLKSLILSTEQYVGFRNFSILSKLPSTLQVLKLNFYHAGFKYSQNVDYYLDHLTSLRYLVIRDYFLTQQKIRAIMQLAIIRQYQILVFLEQSQKRTFDNDGFTKMQAIYKHKYPSLSPHYLAYKRKIIQCFKMHKSYLWKASIHVREEVLQITKSSWEMGHPLTTIAW